MPFPSETYLQFLRGKFHWVVQEFENLYAQFAGYLNQQHRDDGSHTDVTADSLDTKTITIRNDAPDDALGRLDFRFKGRDNYAAYTEMPAVRLHDWGNTVSSQAAVGLAVTLVDNQEVCYIGFDGSGYGIFGQPDLVTPSSTARLGIGPSKLGSTTRYWDEAHIYTLYINAGSSALTWYKEDTWTPALKFGGASTGMTGSFSGTYTRIGRITHLIANIALTAKGSSTGVATITGLPFIVLGNASGCSGLHANFAAGVTVVQGFAVTGTQRIDLYYQGAGGSVQMLDTDLTNTSTFIFSATYFV